MDSPTAGLFWDLDEQNSTNASCHQFTSEQWNALIIARTVTASLSCLACFIAFIMMIVFKAYKQFVHRLILYLTLAAFCLSILYALQILPTKEVGDTILLRVGWGGLCTAIAFLDQYTGWVMLLILCWISLYIFLLAVFRCSTAKRKYELFGLLFIVVLPLTYIWIPFLSGRYGLAGAWCWIKLTTDSKVAGCNGSYTEGLEYQIGLWYGPSIVMTSLSFIGIMALVVAFCKGMVHSETSSLHQKALKEAAPLLIYLIYFNFINCLDIVNRIYYAAVTLSTDANPYFPLWMANAIAGPGRPLIIPFAFSFSLVMRHIQKRNETRTPTLPPSETAYIVSKECTSEEQPLIISQRSQNKHTCRVQ